MALGKTVAVAFDLCGVGRVVNTPPGRMFRSCPVDIRRGKSYAYRGSTKGVFDDRKV
jgi:hypothetical protein